MPEKILLIGPVNGRLSDLISKVSAIQSKHGPFAALFILGDLFHPSPSETQLAQQNDLLQGKLQLPIPMYFYQGSTSPSDGLVERIAGAEKEKEHKDIPQGLVRIADNLFYATGKSGVFVTRHGFRVAFVGGVWDAQKYAESAGEPFDAETWYQSDEQRALDEGLAHITPATVHRLLAHSSFRLPSQTSSMPTTTQSNGAKSETLAAARASASADQARITAQTAALETLNARPLIDLLLTNCWPTGITLFSTPNETLPDPTTRMWGSPAIARIAAHACPRYHFALAPSASDSDLPVGIEQETLEMGAFWERAPYVTDLSSALANRGNWWERQQGRRQVERLKAVTRFVSLARFANEKKKRWFLALNLTPAEKQETVAVPSNATQTPYFTPGLAAAAVVGGQNGKRSAPTPSAEDSGPNFRFQESKRARGSEDVPPIGYVCRICNVEGHFIRACPQKQQQQQQQPSTTSPPSTERSQMPLPAGLPSKPLVQRKVIPVGPSNCWFCLSNPNVTKSLIVSIGAESYLVFPKGGFVHPSISNVPGAAAHVLVVPLSHVSNLLPAGHPAAGGREGEEEERKKTREEMESTKDQVREVWAKTGHSMLEWTLVRVKTSSRMTHFQTQLVALLSSIVQSHNLVQVLDDGLQSTAPKQGILRGEDVPSFFTQTSGDELDGYFHLVLHSQHGQKQQWLVPLTTTCRFPVQFVRTTLAKTLELPQLADWKTAQVEDETEEVERERSAGLRRLLSL